MIHSLSPHIRLSRSDSRHTRPKVPLARPARPWTRQVETSCNLVTTLYASLCKCIRRDLLQMNIPYQPNMYTVSSTRSYRTHGVVVDVYLVSVPLKPYDGRVGGDDVTKVWMCDRSERPACRATHIVVSSEIVDNWGRHALTYLDGNH